MYSEFPEKLTGKDKEAWKGSASMYQDFGANHKVENYVELVENLLESHGQMSCRISLKVHILDFHLDKFKENVEAYSEEQGKCLQTLNINIEDYTVKT